MESKGCKRFATTTEAEIEEKRLKLNAERTIKQNKAAETGKILHTRQGAGAPYKRFVLAA
jgi:hypothetical protein